MIKHKIRIKLKGTIRKIGNSYGILISKAFFDQKLLKEGQEAIIECDENER